MMSLFRPALLAGLPALLLAGLSGCGAAQEAVPPGATGPVEVRPRILPLPDWLAPATSMISGLAWRGDDLFLLPQQRPVSGEASVHRGKLYSIPRAALRRELDTPSGDPLPVDVWTLVAPGIDTLPGFEGLEAIAFAGDTVFMTVEGDAPATRGAWILRGRVEPGTRTIVTAPPETFIPARSGIENLTQEALVVHGGELITMHEANGAAVNPDPVAHALPVHSLPGSPWTVREIPMTRIEYRVTDASAGDASGRFWVTNFHYERDRALWAEDRVFGGPPPRSRGAGRDWVERLVELRVTPEGVVASGRPPVYLEPGDVSRNWEGVARMGGRGLLIVTDKFPGTVLAFVPIPGP